MKRKCICELCTCGRHRCPHNPTNILSKSGQSCVLTEYVEKFPQYGDVKPPKSLKPKAEYYGNHGKIEGVTTFKADYVPYEAVNRPVRVHEEYQPKPGNIELGTTYNRDYNPYKIDPVAPVRPVEKTKMNTGKFDAHPTYKDDYRPWDTHKRELAKQERVYQPPTEKFGNSTTFQDDFFPKEIMARESFKPLGVAKHSDIPFEATTSHRISYVPHEIEPRFMKEKPEYKPSSQPLDDLTTHRVNFKGALGEITKSYKPEHGKIGSSARFEGSTEFRERFQPWEIPSPYVIKSYEYIPPKAHMQFDTTTNQDFVPHQLDYVPPIRPVSHGRRSNVPFQGNTTMKDDFRPWEAKRQELIKREHEISKPMGKFEGVTTFKSHYQPHEIIPTQSFKPQGISLRSSVPFEGGTMYRSEFTPKKNEVCPANFALPPGYVFEGVDNRGHKIFQKIPTPKMNAFGNRNENSIGIAKEIAVAS